MALDESNDEATGLTARRSVPHRTASRSLNRFMANRVLRSLRLVGPSGPCRTA